MATTKSKGKPAARNQASTERNRAVARAKNPSAAPSKQATIIALLSAPSGSTIAAMMKASGWQQHSVRGFLAGVVRKKLKLNLVSEKKSDGDRIYRVSRKAAVTAKPSAAPTSPA